MITQVRKSLIAKYVCFFFPIEKKKENPSKKSVLTKWQEKQLWPWAEEVCTVLRRDKHGPDQGQPYPWAKGNGFS